MYVDSLMIIHEGDWVYDTSVDLGWEKEQDFRLRIGATAPKRTPYKPTQPRQPIIWDTYKGFNPKRWPNTYKTLLLLTSTPEWHKECKWTPGHFPDLRKDHEK